MCKQSCKITCLSFCTPMSPPVRPVTSGSVYNYKTHTTALDMSVKNHKKGRIFALSFSHFFHNHTCICGAIIFSQPLRAASCEPRPLLSTQIDKYTLALVPSFLTQSSMADFRNFGNLQADKLSPQPQVRAPEL